LVTPKSQPKKFLNGSFFLAACKITLLALEKGPDERSGYILGFYRQQA